MTVSFAIALIVIADIALVAALAYVMSRASKLDPHISTLSAQAPQTVSLARRVPARRPRRTSRVLASAASR
jgi:predicted membrane protein